ncbi:hypothetical protein AOLI_G00243130 [Acnodon oligacanthus]
MPAFKAPLSGMESSGHPEDVSSKDCATAGLTNAPLSWPPLLASVADPNSIHGPLPGSYQVPLAPLTSVDSFHGLPSAFRNFFADSSLYSSSSFSSFSSSSFKSEKEAILKELEDLKPPLEPLRILLHGPVGAGKSCFINSVQRVFLGRNVMCALESSTTAIQGESFTLSISTYKMKKQGGGYYPIVFSDIMGLETDRDGIQIEDIIKVLEGHILEGYKFHPRESIANDDKRYNPIPSLGDKIHCLVSIIPADTISRMDDSVIDKMRKIRKKASELNLPQVLVLTKVDTACDIVSQDLRKLYHSKKIKEKVEVSSHKLGIPLKNIYPIKNYHSEITEDANVDVLIVMALRDIVNFANDYVDVRVQLAPPAASSGRRQQGKPKVIMLTKVEEACEEADGHLRKIYHRKKIAKKECVETTLRYFGLNFGGVDFGRDKLRVNRHEDSSVNSLTSSNSSHSETHSQFNPDTGRGIFSSVHFDKGDFLLEYRGELISKQECERRQNIHHGALKVFMFEFRYNGKLFCDGLLHLKSVKEHYGSSFLPAAVKLYNQQSSE